jgi:raffinose/stachyose/melibiose transport system permease protein
MRTGRTASLLTYGLLTICIAFAATPIVSTVAQSFQVGARGNGLSFDSYSRAWTGGNFTSALVSSVVVTVLVVVVSITLGSLAAFAFVAFGVPGERFFLCLLLIGLVLPYEVTVLPLYQLLSQWHLVDTWAALILPQIGLSMPLSIFWMRGFFGAIPKDLRDAGGMDGATNFQVFRLIMMPISRPAILTLAVLVFLYTWNEFLLALVLLPTNQAAQTAPLALSAFSGAQHGVDPSVTAAAAVLVALPVVAIYVILQRRIISGIVEGAVK